jgi:hypothetical protein
MRPSLSRPAENSLCFIFLFLLTDIGQELTSWLWCLIIAAAFTPQSSNAKASYTSVKIDVFLPQNGEALMETRL